MAERDTLNDHHEPSRPGWIVYIGLLGIAAAVIFIMLANKVAPPASKVSLGAHNSASLTG
jgi:hypothetical protein